MDHHREQATDEQRPSDDRDIVSQGEKNRKEMDSVPEHGTDPLHEGP